MHLHNAGALTNKQTTRSLSAVLKHLSLAYLEHLPQKPVAKGFQVAVRSTVCEEQQGEMRGVIAG